MQELKRRVGRICVAWLLAVIGAVIPLSAQSIEFRYEDHPPFTFEKDGEPAGIFIGITEQSAKLAGFNIIWKKSTFNRLKRDLEEGVERFCVTGHSKASDSEGKWHTTEAIGHFGRAGFLVRAEDRPDFLKVGSLQALFEKTEFVGGFVKGAVYAVPYEKFLATSHSKHLITSSTHEQLVQLVAKGRLDFVFINDVMLPSQQALAEGDAKLDFVTFSEMPYGASAHIRCTKAFPAAQVARLNRGILEATKKAAQE